eukprot:gene29189-38256_t
MNKSDSSDLAEAIRRAESRAAVIQSLKLSYGTKPKVAAAAAVSITTESTNISAKEKKKTVNLKESINNAIDSNLPVLPLPLGGANTLPGKTPSSSSKTESSGYGNLKSTARAADLIVQSMKAWRPKGNDLTRDQVWLTDSIHNKLYGSDRMGALVHVMHSERCPNLIGLRGVVVAESKGCLFLANYCKAHRGPRRKVRTVGVEGGKGGDQVDNVCNEEDDNAVGNVCTARDSSAKVDSVCISEKESGDAETKKKTMKVARVVKEDCVLALVVTLPVSNKGKEEVEQGEEGETEEGSGSGRQGKQKGETQLQLLHRACRADITCEDENKKGSIIYLLHGEKCLPFCKGGIS